MIEVIIAIAITAIITGSITMTIFQVFDGNIRNSNHMIAVKQVENAGYWISHDTLMAQNIDTDDDAGTAETEILILTWVGWGYESGSDTCIDSHEVRYTYDSISDKLWRHQRITTEKYDSSGQWVETIYSPGPTENDWDTTPSAHHITTIPTAAMDGNKLIVTIKAEVGEAEEERTYEVIPRPGS